MDVKFVVPMMRIERMTSPLPRECSTTEPHGQILERVKGIEPSSGAWKASALPLSYTRSGNIPLRVSLPASIADAVRWWRGMDSNHRRRKPTDLQSAPFSHSGTPPLGERRILPDNLLSVKQKSKQNFRENLNIWRQRTRDKLNMMHCQLA